MFHSFIWNEFWNNKIPYTFIFPSITVVWWQIGLVGAEQFQGIFHAVGGNSSPSSDREWRRFLLLWCLLCKRRPFSQPLTVQWRRKFFVKVKVTLESQQSIAELITSNRETRQWLGVERWQLTLKSPIEEHACLIFSCFYSTLLSIFHVVRGLSQITFAFFGIF